MYLVILGGGRDKEKEAKVGGHGCKRVSRGPILCARLTNDIGAGAHGNGYVILISVFHLDYGHYIPCPHDTPVARNSLFVLRCSTFNPRNQLNQRSQKVLWGKAIPLWQDVSSKFPFFLWCNIKRCLTH